MILSKQDVVWWENHTNNEIADKFSISAITVSRTKKKYNIKNVRKKGSGPKHAGIVSKCKNVNCDNDVYLPKSKIDIGMYCSRTCVFSDAEYREKLRTMDKSYMQSEGYKNTLRKDTTPEYRRYANAVHKLSHKVYEGNIDIINPNRYTRTLAGVEGGYQLDHILPIKEGFKRGVSVEKMSEVSNLRMLPWNENLSRNRI